MPPSRECMRISKQAEEKKKKNDGEKKRDPIQSLPVRCAPCAHLFTGC